MKNRGTYPLLALFFAGLVGLWVADFAQVPTRSPARTDEQPGPPRADRHQARRPPEDRDPRRRRADRLRASRREPLADDRADERRGRPLEGRDPRLQPQGTHQEARGRTPSKATRAVRPGPARADDPALGDRRPTRRWPRSNWARPASIAATSATSAPKGSRSSNARGLDLIKLPPIRWRDHELFRVPSFEVDAVYIASGGKDTEAPPRARRLARSSSRSRPSRPRPGSTA